MVSENVFVFICVVERCSYVCKAVLVFWCVVCSVCVCYQGWEQIIEEVVGRATSWFCVFIGLHMLPWQLTHQIVLKVICRRILELFDP